MPANDQVLYYYRHKYEKNIILPIKINLILEKKNVTWQPPINT